MEVTPDPMEEMTRELEQSQQTIPPTAESSPSAEAPQQPTPSQDTDQSTSPTTASPGCQTPPPSTAQVESQAEQSLHTSQLVESDKTLSALERLERSIDQWCKGNDRLYDAFHAGQSPVTNDYVMERLKQLNHTVENMMKAHAELEAEVINLRERTLKFAGAVNQKLKFLMTAKQ